MILDPFRHDNVARDLDFRIMVNGDLAAEVWGPSNKRDWVLNRLSHHLAAFAVEGEVTVERKTNGEWRRTDDWNKLTH